MTAVLEPQTPDRVTDLVDLYRERRERLVGYAARFAGGRDQGEDAVQDAFVALLTNPEQIHNAAAYVGAHARGNALGESTRRGRQVPVGDAMAWQPDTAPPAEDLDTLAACMGDPTVVTKVEAALQTLSADQQQCVRMYCLDRKTAAAIGVELGIPRSTAYERVTTGLANLERLGLKYDEDEGKMTAGEPEPAAEPAPARKRKLPAGIPTVEELTATLDREHPGEWLGPVPAHETLRRVHGRCSAKRAALAQYAHNGPLTPPMRIRAGLSAESRAAANAELVETLGREFPGRMVTNDEAETTLRHIHETCSLGRARQARVEHNAKVLASEGVNTDAPSEEPTTAVTPAQVEVEGPGVTTVPVQEAAPALRPVQPATALATTEGNATVVFSPTVGATASVTQAVAPTAGASQGPVVAEVWLMGAKPPISCLLVHTDETTANRDLVAVSLPGAQREITGQLIGAGYRPDGPWIDVDPAAPEAMRKFQQAEGGQS